jgi:hypothetical protein
MHAKETADVAIAAKYKLVPEEISPMKRVAPINKIARG